MEIKLIKLTLHNFMGIQDFTFDPNGANAIAKGANGVGKTTLFSALWWLLFDRDAQGRSDFEIKTVDENNRPYSGLDHTVGATLEIDGKEVGFKKTYREDWKRKRGNTKKTFHGHKVEYYVDGVPVKKTEWKNRINNLIDEDLFKLLTSPFYFPSLHWEKKRKLLTSLCPEVTDEEVVKQNPDLSELPDILGDRSLEDHRKAVKSRQQEINKRLQEIPARIDELNESIKEAGQHSPHLLKERIKELNNKLEKAKAEGVNQEIAEERRSLEKELQGIWDEAEKEQRNKVKEIQDEIDRLKDERRKLSQELRDTEQQLKDLDNFFRQNQKKRDELRQEFHEVKQQDPGDEVRGECPTCGQAIPDDQFDEAIEKARKRQADKLKEIQEQGRRLKAEADEKGTEQEKLRARSDELDSQIATIDQSTEAKEAELKNAQSNQGTVSPREHKINQRLNEIQQIEQTTGKPDTSEIEAELEEKRATLAQVEAAQTTRDRIQELKKEEESLGAEYEKLQQEIYLMERFSTAQAELLESRINSMFSLARFKLFEEQVDGGINPTCQILYKGVPFNHGLNTGAQINTGLDIIRTLEHHFQVQAPIFVDHAESISEILDPGCQVIKLVHDPKVKELQVEVEQENKQEAVA